MSRGIGTRAYKGVLQASVCSENPWFCVPEECLDVVFFPLKKLRGQLAGTLQVTLRACFEGHELVTSGHESMVTPQSVT